jgi:hypothetical protein
MNTALQAFKLNVAFDQFWLWNLIKSGKTNVADMSGQLHAIQMSMLQVSAFQKSMLEVRTG